MGCSSAQHSWINQPEQLGNTDACHDLAKDPGNLILNQFGEYGNYIIHRAVTGPALQRIFDHLKQVLGTQTGVIEALECPTLLYNGYGEHNIQGIGDKHVPLIHNVMGSDFVIGVSDAACDGLNLVFNTTAGRTYLSNYRKLAQEQITALGDLGLSSIANILGAIKYAKYMNLGADDVVLTVATDGADMYHTEMATAERKYFPSGFGEVQAAEAFGRYSLGVGIDHMAELGRFDHERIFNLAYYTWVEQQGTPLEDFDRRRDQPFWDNLLDLVPVWDDMIDHFNNGRTRER